MRLTKIQLIIFLFIMISLSYFIFVSNIKGNVILEKEKILGYCPTMESYAFQIKDSNNIILNKYDNTINVLNSLNKGDIDIALIGRIAKENEVDYSYKLMIGEGYTLVSNTKQFIMKQELNNLVVHTYLDKEIVEKYLPNSEIIYYDSLEESFNGVSDINDAVFIDWFDYNYEMELVVVLEENLKAKEFRIPVLYSVDYDLNSLNLEI